MTAEREREDEIGRENDGQPCGIVKRPEWKRKMEKERKIKIGGGFWGAKESEKVSESR